MCPDVIIYLFNHITQKRDWKSRLGLLLTYPFLREYSKTIGHMSIILQDAHKRGCPAFKHYINRPLPSTLTKAWLHNIMIHLRAKNQEHQSYEKENSVIRMIAPHHVPCDYCGLVPLCNII